MRNALALCEARGTFLFEACPDLFPYDRVTELETALWARFYEERHARRRK